MLPLFLLIAQLSNSTALRLTTNTFEPITTPRIQNTSYFGLALPRSLKMPAILSSQSSKGSKADSRGAGRARVNTEGDHVETKGDDKTSAGPSNKKERMKKTQALVGNKLMASIVKMCLMTAQEVGFLSAANYNSFLIKSDEGSGKALRTVGNNYSEQCQSLGRSHGLEPPSIH